MNSSEQNPRLPIWIFLATDAVLLGTAWFIATQSARPLSSQAMFAILACIFGGALIALVPLVARVERQKNETLDERQRELEALARTVGASAEQISIAVSSLHQIAEATQKNLRQAEQLPHKLHEKITEFQAQLTNAADTGKDELEKELETLRASESERLESIAARIAKSTADWARLEAATQKHLSAASEAMAKLSPGQAGPAAQVAPASGPPAEKWATATSAPEPAPVLVERASRIMARAAESERHESAAARIAKSTADWVRLEAATQKHLSAASEASSRLSSGHAGPAAQGVPASEPPAEGAAPEPPPVLVEKITRIAPVAPATADPFPDHPPAKPATAKTAAGPGHANGDRAAPVATRPSRKRSTKRAAPDAAGPERSPAASDADGAEAIQPGVVERVLTSDGATRLVVTAYIGIGNRLFIRGEGPGLSWEKGVPLQFVSIGKWRWETNDAWAPVKFKLFKNDDLECAALGAQSLDPGYQQEVTAAF